MDQFEAYFQRADLDRDGRISGAEAVGFFRASNLAQPVLAQIWNYADHNRAGFLGRQEFYNALKLVTVAQSNRELTSDIVKAALHGPASAKIPAPRINLAVLPNVQPNTHGPQGAMSQHNQLVRPPRPPMPDTALHGQQVVARQGTSQGNLMTAPRPSSDFLGGRNGNTQPGDASHLPDRGMGGTSGIQGSSPSTQPRTQPSTMVTQPVSSKAHDSTSVNQIVGKDSKGLPVTTNGTVSDSLFGDVFSISPSQPKQDSQAVVASTSSNVPASGPQPLLNPGPVNHSQNALAQQPLGNQHQKNHLAVKPDQYVQPPNAFPVATGKAIPGQSQPTWPRMTQADVQKYSKVFFQVDNDRDGKITGDQARHLFLSWGLRREILKQVWDLSDQDNDSMLSLREFCVALYLMERSREGRPLPSVFPSNAIIDETMLPSAGPPTAAYGNASWRPSGFQQQHPTKGSRPPVPPSLTGKPPRAPLLEEPTQPSPPKPKVPVLEKHLLEQLSTGEQNALNSKFQEASDAEKKVVELEKEIMEAKEKIQFYHAKMQELILYKSRCDNRLNEIIESISGDKQEVEILSKKYEQKYKQSGDVASKLTIEEATFRDIQDKKMELYRAIVKLDQDESADKFQDKANHIQSDIDEIVKSLNERCKTYGLRGKPISLLELPFGWQHGIQEAAADWDESWDKFEEEGFTFDKELTLDVQNVIAPPKPKIPLVRDKATSAYDSKSKDSPPTDSDTAEKLPDYKKRNSEDESTNDRGEEQRARNSSDSQARSNDVESPSNDLHDSQSKKDGSFDGSPREIQSEHNGVEPIRSGDKAFDEPGWGTFDTDFDADAAWDANPIGAKDEDLGRPIENSFFGSEDWGLNPIKTGTTRDNTYPKQSPFFDSVPSTPNTFANQGPFLNSVPSTPNTFAKPNAFSDSVPSTPNTYAMPNTFDSVPSTPAQYAMHSSFFDSVPSTPLYNSVNSPNADIMFQTRSPFAFADSVPSTPMGSGNSPRRLSEGSQDNSFNTFSRFDSFNLHDSGPFAAHESLSRFDSMKSTRDSDNDPGFFPSQQLSRFDSFRSTADSEYNPGAFPSMESFSRFDSFRSTADSEYNPGVFPQREPFSRFDSFRSTADSEYNPGDFPQRESFTRFDSTSSTRDSGFGHGFQSFDDADPFGSNEQFKTSQGDRTPRRDSDSWKAS